MAHLTVGTMCQQKPSLIIELLCLEHPCFLHRSDVCMLCAACMQELLQLVSVTETSHILRCERDLESTVLGAGRVFIHIWSRARVGAVLTTSSVSAVCR